MSHWTQDCLVLHSTLPSSLSDWSASGTAFYPWGIQLLLRSWVKLFRGQPRHLSHSFADVSILVISDSPFQRSSFLLSRSPSNVNPIKPHHPPASSRASSTLAPTSCVAFNKSFFLCLDTVFNQYHNLCPDFLLCWTDVRIR